MRIRETDDHFVSVKPSCSSITSAFAAMNTTNLRLEPGLELLSTIYVD